MVSAPHIITDAMTGRGVPLLVDVNHNYPCELRTWIRPGMSYARLHFSREGNHFNGSVLYYFVIAHLLHTTITERSMCTYKFQAA